MSGRRRKNQLQPAFMSGPTGEARNSGRQGTEPLVASREPESPAVDEPLMEEVCERENLKRAWRRVRDNKGSPGIDGVTIEEMPDFLRERWPTIREEPLRGSYEPLPVKRVEIPKPGGGVGKLGIPAMIDRLIQQAVPQALQRGGGTQRFPNTATVSGRDAPPTKRWRGRNPWSPKAMTGWWILTWRNFSTGSTTTS